MFARPLRHSHETVHHQGRRNFRSLAGSVSYRHFPCDEGLAKTKYSVGGPPAERNDPIAAQRSCLITHEIYRERNRLWNVVVREPFSQWQRVGCPVEVFEFVGKGTAHRLGDEEAEHPRTARNHVELRVIEADGGVNVGDDKIGAGFLHYRIQTDFHPAPNLM